MRRTELSTKGVRQLENPVIINEEEPRIGAKKKKRALERDLYEIQSTLACEGDSYLMIGLNPNTSSHLTDGEIQVPQDELFPKTHSYLGIVCCLVAQSCPTLCDSMDCSTPGFPVLHYLSDFVQTHIH